MLAFSQWAHRNPITSRLLIALGHVLIIANALLLGLLLYWWGWSPSTLTIAVLVSIYGFAYLRYPTMLGRLTKAKYRKQKTSDFLMVLSYALLIAFSLNNYLAIEDDPGKASLEESATTLMLSALAAPAAPAAAVSPKAPLTKAERRQARRSQIKVLKTQIKAWKKDNKGKKKGGDVGKILLTCLVIAIALGLALIVAALACGLSCNGQGGLALVLVLGGLTAIVWLSVIVLKGVFKNGSSPPARQV